MYQEGTINLNSWDPATQVVPSPEDPIFGDLNSATVDEATHSFGESLKIFYKEGRVFGEVETFYNHSAVLFVRFDPAELQDIKMCQLQVVMYNKGIFEALKELEALDDRAYHSPEWFPTLTTDPSTYAPDFFTMDTELDDWSFTQYDKNLIVLENRITSDVLQKFINSKSWGPAKADITSVADLKFVYTPGGIHGRIYMCVLLLLCVRNHTKCCWIYIYICVCFAVTMG
jgi:hypothetical protein